MSRPGRYADPGLAIHARNRGAAEANSKESRLVGIAAISVILPFGFLLALWPLSSGRGRAWKLSLLAIAINIPMWIFLAMLLFFRLPNC